MVRAMAYEHVETIMNFAEVSVAHIIIYVEKRAAHPLEQFAVFVEQSSNQLVKTIYWIAILENSANANTVPKAAFNLSDAVKIIYQTVKLSVCESYFMGNTVLFLIISAIL